MVLASDGRVCRIIDSLALSGMLEVLYSSVVILETSSELGDRWRRAEGMCRNNRRAS